MHCLYFSESSMFVTKQRFILKTCGRTTLLFAVEPLLKLAKDSCGFDKVEVGFSLVAFVCTFKEFATLLTVVPLYYREKFVILDNRSLSSENIE